MEGERNLQLLVRCWKDGPRRTSLFFSTSLKRGIMEARLSFVGGVRRLVELWVGVGLRAPQRGF